MGTYKHLLFELGSEELPPKTLLKLSNALLNNVIQGLNAAELTFTGSKAYATPRRLAVLIENLATAQPDTTVEKRGPAIQAAFAPDGSPSKAALGFAASCGTTFGQLERLKTDKGEWLSFTQAVKGQATEQLIPDIIRQSIAALPIAKRMRWGSFATEFVRPVHWAVLLFGESMISTEILGLTTGNATQGHRFHAPEQIVVNKPEDYEAALYTHGKVIADIEQRKTIIREAAQKAAAAVNGIAHIEEDLLEEIAALNEWPVPVTGNFDPRFLALPAEVLITTMQTNQKYFPVKNPPTPPFAKGDINHPLESFHSPLCKRGAGGDLLPHFITFSNIESTRPESIQHGNERVVTPRLADAEFFWNQDRKKTLEARVASLDAIVFQENLGTVLAKTKRVQNLAEFIAKHINASVELAKRAALLAKTDLMTEMVGEFGNLQGIMGRYYALAEGEAPEVAWALEEQYFPKQSGSPTASSTTGQILAIAEKIDTLAGIFEVGLIPTGDKDPYALRRAALGILRTIIENKLNINIIELTEFASVQINPEPSHVGSGDKMYATGYVGNPPSTTSDRVIDFIFERLKGYCLDHGYTSDEFEAVMTVKPAEPLDFMQRLQAVKTFRQLPEAQSLAAANKRIRNILKKSDTAPAENIGLLVEPQEQQLLIAAQQSANDIQPLLAQRDYQAALNRLAGLRSDVDAFFDNVMVMSDDLELRANRLALLQFLSRQFLTCADISRLQS
ncbi:MAG: glycine--tRNA ligase subunit beta [Methylovulum sp.]|nr:glycine--tRNA ligase subunit beta [Methylovulum sp.]